MTATMWNSESMEPTGWWMTEKFDGVRLYWDGNALFTRQGNRVKAPEIFTRQLPTFPLDGELW
jgi:DNA ligase-1